jgi:ABC-type branched-subunit amino acid transport system ATPase component
MLAIGRGLMAEAKLLMLDEPSLGLSPLFVQYIFEIIDKLQADDLAGSYLGIDVAQHRHTAIARHQIVDLKHRDDLRNRHRRRADP